MGFCTTARTPRLRSSARSPRVLRAEVTTTVNEGSVFGTLLVYLLPLLLIGLTLLAVFLV